MIVDFKTGKLIDPPVAPVYVKLKDYNELVEAHSSLYHKFLLLEKRLNKLEKPKRRWRFF